MILKEINRPTKQIRILSLRPQKQLPENPFLHTQLPIVLMTLLMITFHWLAKVPTLLSILFIFFFRANWEKALFWQKLPVVFTEQNCNKNNSSYASDCEILDSPVDTVFFPHRQLHPNTRIRRTEFLICACIQLKFLEVIHWQCW